jgi:hypothetical protein
MVQGLPGHPELGRHQHGAMALLDSGQFHQGQIPAFVMWRTAVVVTGERGEHDKGTKPPIPAHATMQAPTGLPAETVLADTRCHSVSTPDTEVADGPPAGTDRSS